MKSLIIYGSPKKLRNNHQVSSGQSQYFIRIETFNGDYPEALDKARPMDGETVLNTVPVEEAT